MRRKQRVENGLGETTDNSPPVLLAGSARRDDRVPRARLNPEPRLSTFRRKNYKLSRPTLRLQGLWLVEQDSPFYSRKKLAGSR